MNPVILKERPMTPMLVIMMMRNSPKLPYSTLRNMTKVLTMMKNIIKRLV